MKRGMPLDPKRAFDVFIFQDSCEEEEETYQAMVANIEKMKS
jgi:hypothetical protein